MKNLFKSATLLLTLCACLYSCSSNSSKQGADTALNSVKGSTALKSDTAMQGVTSVTTTKTETSTTVDPVTGDSTITTKTVIKHRGKN